MKIVAVLETSLKAGGAHNQSLNALIQMKRICAGRFDLVIVAFDLESVNLLNNKGLNGVIIKFSIIEKFKNLFFQAASRYNVLPAKVIFPIERRLLDIDADLIYFLGPSLLSLKIKKINYIFTIFDVAHRDHPEFPEVREYNEFLKREELYSKVIGQSYITLTDSSKLLRNVSRYYGVDSSRLICMPFAPSSDLDHNSCSIIKVRDLYKLPEIYFFYPAQFWPHKNHLRILEALELLNRENKIMHVVFSGGDKGNLNYIEEKVKILNLEDQIHFLGLVPHEHMKSLFQGSCGVIMPTYFGPTNLPPMEAWSLGVPLIYSAHLSDHAKDAALLVDPDSSKKLSLAMLEITKPDVKEQLVANGYLRIDAINKERELFETKFLEKLMIFEKHRNCWE
jgi:glycosyltransferase involved in cell wall biosynthesis